MSNPRFFLSKKQERQLSDYNLSLSLNNLDNIPNNPQKPKFEDLSPKAQQMVEDYLRSVPSEETIRGPGQ